MASATGTATIDFGVAPGSNEASIAVTGQTEITALGKCEAWVMGDGRRHKHRSHSLRPQVFPRLCITDMRDTIGGCGFHHLRTLNSKTNRELDGSIRLD